MHEAEYIDCIVAHGVNEYVRQRGEHEFPRASLSARAAHEGKSFKGLGCRVKALQSCDSEGRVMKVKVPRDVFEVSNGGK